MQCLYLLSVVKWHTYSAYIISLVCNVYTSAAHFNHLLNQGVPIPIQTGAQIPFLVITYATIGMMSCYEELIYGMCHVICSYD